MRSRHRLVAVLAAAGLAAVGVTGATADRPSPGSPSWAGAGHPERAAHAGAPAHTEVATVTLITGDRVRLTSTPDGTRTATPLPGRGRSAEPFSIRYRDDRIDVVPADAAPLVMAGKLDGNLFDVAGLVAAGLDDARSREIPLLVTYVHDRSGPVVTRGASAVRTGLPGHTTKLSARKDDATAFWQWIAGPHPGGSGAVETESVAAVATSGVERVSLDMANRAAASVGAGRAAAPRTRSLGVAQHRLRVRLIDRNGKLATDLGRSFLTQPVVLNRDTEDAINLQADSGGLVATVPDGHYSFGEIVVTSHGLKPNSYSLLARPDFDVSGNLTLTLDARQARQVQVAVDAPDAKPTMTTFGTMEMFAGRPWTTLVTLPGSTRYPFYATTISSVTDRSYDFALFQTLTSSRGTYDILVGGQGRIPPSTNYKVHDSDLAKIDGVFYQHGAGAGDRGVWFREAELPGDVQVGLGWFYPVPYPSRRMHLTSTFFQATPLRWSSSVDTLHGNDLVATSTRDASAFQPRQEIEQPWDRSPFRPGASGVRTAGAGMELTAEPFSPAVADLDRAIIDRSGVTGGITLRRDGEIVAQSGNPFELVAGPQPSAEAEYQMDLQATRSQPWERYGTKVNARWQFTSKGGTDLPQDLRLVNLFVMGDVDMYGRAPAGTDFPVDLRVVGAGDAGAARSVTLSVSFDDGTTWTSVPTSKVTSTLWRATVKHPNTPGGYVSVRTSVTTDRTESSRTSIRAYGLVPKS